MPLSPPPPSATAAADPATVLVLGYVDLASVSRPVMSVHDRIACSGRSRGWLAGRCLMMSHAGRSAVRQDGIVHVSRRHRLAHQNAVDSVPAFDDATGGATSAPMPRQTDWGRETSAAVNVLATGGAPAAAGAMVHRACRVSFMVQSCWQ